MDIITDALLTVLQSQCLVKMGAHVAAAVLYQCFAPEEMRYGLRILQLAPESHDDTFFQYFWEVRTPRSFRIERSVLIPFCVVAVLGAAGASAFQARAPQP